MKRLEKDSVATNVELVELKAHLAAAYENEKELQRKVVALTLQKERLEPFESELAATQVQLQTVKESQTAVYSRLEQANEQLVSAKEDVKREKEMKEKLEKVLKEVNTLQALGENVQKLQTSLQTVGL